MVADLEANKLKSETQNGAAGVISFMLYSLGKRLGLKCKNDKCKSEKIKLFFFLKFVLGRTYFV